MAIPKIARQPELLRRPSRLFPNARAGFKAFLQALRLAPGEHVLLPAYVGWSPHEGSGVLDPVTELGLPVAFYRVDRALGIDLEHLAAQLAARPVRVVVIIHYFGYVAAGVEDAVALARQHGAAVLEDEAHAMFTDVLGGLCGRRGDACIFSLHKLLPLGRGGALVLNESSASLLERLPEADEDLPSPWDYDFAEIARRRQENAAALPGLLAPLAEEIAPLWAPPRPGEIPQTFPVLIKRVDRNQLYFALNEAGFGVVTLYHTLVDAIDRAAFPDSHWLSRRILNLPVHQETSPDALAEMTAFLATALPAMPDREDG